MPSTLQIVLLSVAAVFVVTFALLPKKRRIWTAGLVSLCIVSVEVGVIGTMPFFGIGLDAVSMISLAICVGFAADFSAHVAYHFQSGLPFKTTSYQTLSFPLVKKIISPIFTSSFRLRKMTPVSTL